MIDPLAPVTIEETSVTERADFRLCRRRWFLGTVKRWQPVGGAPHFWFGNLIHYALEHYYLAQMDDEDDPTSPMEIGDAEAYAYASYDHFLADTLPGIKKDLGFLWESVSDEYDTMIDMGRGMLAGYFLMERETGGQGSIVAVEERLGVPIRNENGRAFPGSPRLTGRFDLVVEKAGGAIWIIDHKTAAQKHNSAYLDIDDQLTGYAYVWFRTYGEVPRGQVYNVLLKKVPGPPRRLKDTKEGVPVLSQDKSQATTYSLYLAEIKRLGLDRREYQGMLTFLKERGWQDYYIQEGVFRNMAQLRQFELNLAHEWRDMRDVAAHPEKAYPSPSAISCPGCPVKLICQTMQDGGDVEAIIEGQFSIAPERR